MVLAFSKGAHRDRSEQVFGRKIRFCRLSSKVRGVGWCSSSAHSFCEACGTPNLFASGDLDVVLLLSVFMMTA